MDELKLRSKDCDIIGIVETWSKDSITDGELALKGFNMFRTDKKESNGIGGGLILYIKDVWQASYHSDLAIGPQLL